MSKHISHTNPKATASKLINYIMHEGAAHGVTDARVQISWVDQYKVAVENGEVAEMSSGAVENIGITIYAGKKCLEFQQASNDLASIKKAIADNFAALPHVPENPDNALLAKELVSPAYTEDLDLEDKTGADNETMIRFAKDIEAAARANQSVKAVRSVSLKRSHGKTLDMATNGLEIMRSRTSYSAGATVIAESEHGMQVSGDYATARHFADLPAAAEIGKKAAENACAKLNASTLDTGDYPIVLAPEVAGEFFAQVLSGIDGSKVFKGTTMFKDKLNKKILNNEVTIEDDPSVQRGLGSRAVDSEGVAASKMNFVEGGVLKNFYVDKYSAKKLGVDLIGREDGLTNTRILPGKTSPAALMADIQKGVLIKGFMGGVFNMNNGTFSRQAYGRLIEDGKVTDKAVSGFVVTSSDLKTVFENLQIADDTPDQKESSSSMCAPTTRLNGMTIAGN